MSLKKRAGPKCILPAGGGAGEAGAGVRHPVADHRGGAEAGQRPPRHQQEAEEAEENLLPERAEEVAGNRERHQRVPRPLRQEAHAARLPHHRG